MQNRLVRLWPALVLLALGLFVFRGLIFSDWILGRGDTFTYFYPYWAARDAFFRAGQLPLWTPNLFMGVPLLANPQVGALYPPNWLTVYWDAPNAVRISALLHVAWATLGAYLLARRSVGLSALAALVTAAVFGFGGYLGAHLEQINQLQGLAWFPWLFWALHANVQAPSVQKVLLLGTALALQILSGHTQTVFICGVGLGVYVLASARPRGLLWLAAASGVALLLASAQLIPTLELVSQSGRDGGLSANAALSFSFSPFIAGRGLLPSYDAKLFSEYIAYVGVSGLMLALVGAFSVPRQGDFPHRRVWTVLLGVSLLLALGAYNPLNWGVVRLPGFDLFRVPARWLALYALSAAVLAGLGTDALQQKPAGRRLLGVAAGLVAALALASLLAGRVPEEINGPALPTLRSWLAWSGALLTTLALMRWRPRMVPLLLGVELAAASLVMPYNDLVPPEMWSAQRFTISQMLAYMPDDSNGPPPGRLLSVSGLLFDPGDKDALAARYTALGMSPLQERYAFVAAKLKETLSPNLPLAWDIPTVDGYGGGLLPTRHYNTLLQLVYPPDADIPVDGRLRENLAQPACRGACLPAERWLDLLDVRYVLTDKVYDVWHEGVAFSTVHAGHTRYSGPPFEADAAQLLFACAAEATCAPASLRVIRVDGTTAIYDDLRVEPVAENTYMAEARFGRQMAVSVALTETADIEPLGAALVDRQASLFLTLPVPGAGWTQLLSSDIRLFEYSQGEGRVLTSAEPRVADSDAQALALLRQGADIVLHAPAEAQSSPRTSQASRPRITYYAPTEIHVRIDAAADEVLLLKDAYYPGWRATVNDKSTAVYRANINFRAISLQPGMNHAIFSYDPHWLPSNFIVATLMWVVNIITTLSKIWRILHDR